MSPPQVFTVVVPVQTSNTRDILSDFIKNERVQPPFFWVEGSSSLNLGREGGEDVTLEVGT